MLEDGATKDGGSDTDSVIRRFREDMGSIDKSIIAKSDFKKSPLETPRGGKEVPLLRKISSEVNVDEKMMQKQEIGPKTEVKHHDSPSTMKKVQAQSVFQSANVDQ